MSLLGLEGADSLVVSLLEVALRAAIDRPDHFGLATIALFQARNASCPSHSPPPSNNICLATSQGLHRHAVNCILRLLEPLNPPLPSTMQARNSAGGCSDVLCATPCPGNPLRVDRAVAASDGGDAEAVEPGRWHWQCH